MEKKLIDVVAEQQNVSKKNAEEMIKAVFEAIKTMLKENIKIRIHGFGTFEPIIRKGRKYNVNGYSGVSSDFKTISFGVHDSFKEALQ